LAASSGGRIVVRERLLLGAALVMMVTGGLVMVRSGGRPGVLAVPGQQTAVHEVDYSPKGSVLPGGTVGIVGRCLDAQGRPPVDTAASLFHRENARFIATAAGKADPDGRFTLVLNVPTDAIPGPARLEVLAIFRDESTGTTSSCDTPGMDRLLLVDYEVATPPGPSAPTTTLPPRTPASRRLPVTR
jgi:hypothetical protein